MGDDTWAGLADRFADEAVRGRRFAAVLCHGVLGYLERPEPVLDQLCRCAADELDPGEAQQVAAVELEAGRRDPCRRLSRIFHLVGRRSTV